MVRAHMGRARAINGQQTAPRLVPVQPGRFSSLENQHQTERVLRHFGLKKQRRASSDPYCHLTEIDRHGLERKPLRPDGAHDCLETSAYLSEMLEAIHPYPTHA